VPGEGGKNKLESISEVKIVLPSSFLADHIDRNTGADIDLSLNTITWDPVASFLLRTRPRPRRRTRRPARTPWMEGKTENLGTEKWPN